MSEIMVLFIKFGYIIIEIGEACFLPASNRREGSQRGEKNGEKVSCRISAAFLSYGLFSHGAHRGAGEDLWERGAGNQPVFCLPQNRPGGDLEGLPDGLGPGWGYEKYCLGHRSA